MNCEPGTVGAYEPGNICSQATAIAALTLF